MELNHENGNKHENGIKLETPDSNEKHLKYWESMEQIDSGMMDEVLSSMEAFDYEAFGVADVERALKSDSCSVLDFQALLSPCAGGYLEEMAQKARGITKAKFGNSVSLFTPLYISNYCESYCVYCGFNARTKVARIHLNLEEMAAEMAEIAKSGLEEVLILTGESPRKSSISYLGEAVKLAREYFSVIGLEVYALNSEDYRYLHQCGADYITVFQETYQVEKYKKLHLGGEKQVFPYRFYAQERAFLGGMRGVGLAALLGLGDFRKDAFATGYHGYLLQKKFPHGEISFSCPRLRPSASEEDVETFAVTERELLQVVCAYRIFMPFANITISTRESAVFRNHVIDITGTKISAGVSVGIGERSKEEESAHQFEIADGRNVDEISFALKQKGLQPVYRDYIYT